MLRRRLMSDSKGNKTVSLIHFEEEQVVDYINTTYNLRFRYYAPIDEVSGNTIRVSTRNDRSNLGYKENSIPHPFRCYTISGNGSFGKSAHLYDAEQMTINFGTPINVKKCGGMTIEYRINPYGNTTVTSGFLGGKGLPYELYTYSPYEEYDNTWVDVVLRTKGSSSKELYRTSILCTENYDFTSFALAIDENGVPMLYNNGYMVTSYYSYDDLKNMFSTSDITVESLGFGAPGLNDDSHFDEIRVSKGLRYPFRSTALDFSSGSEYYSRVRYTPQSKPFTLD